MTNLFWADSTESSGLPAGMYGYAGYHNGPYANISAIKARFPGKPVMSYAVRTSGMQGADAADCEPGTFSSAFSGNAAAVVTFIRNWKGGSGLFTKPVVYCMASWLTQMQDYLTSAGISRSSYWLNSSHATGTAHYCGPGSCGYGKSAADMTQYVFTRTYDKTVMQSYTLKAYAGTTPAVTPAKNTDGETLKPGDHGTAVLHVQQRLYNLRYFLGTTGLDGIFGPDTVTKVKAFQAYRHLSVDGVVGPATWSALKVNPAPELSKPAPPTVATLPAPSALKVTSAGYTSFKATWKAPVGAPKSVAYQVYVYKGSAKAANLVASYPRSTTSVAPAQFGGLARNTAYVLHVVTGTGTQVRPMTYAEVAFKTA